MEEINAMYKVAERESHLIKGLFDSCLLPLKGPQMISLLFADAIKTLLGPLEKGG